VRVRVRVKMVIRFERDPKDKDIYYVLEGDRCATYWLASSGIWCVCHGRGNYRGHLVGGGELSAQLKAIELLGGSGG
jgi:hypothetical protein